jgi:hypothetical protein
MNVCGLKTDPHQNRLIYIHNFGARVNMKKDITRLIEELISNSYLELKADEEYQYQFQNEGVRKAETIVNDLNYKESNGNFKTEKLAYLSIGGADGSELRHVLENTDISRGVLVELSPNAIQLAYANSNYLSSINKEMLIFHGDVNSVLNDCLTSLEEWVEKGLVSGLVCSIQAVLHELPSRASNFNLPEFLGEVYRYSGWKSRFFYSREPCIPVLWPAKVRIRIPSV